MLEKTSLDFTMRSQLQSSGLLLALSASTLIPSISAETVLGAYIFSRHGDRTSKSTPPTYLTDLGYSQVYTTGQYYHDRYISSSSSSKIQGIDPKIVKAGQLTASAPEDEVLQNSATAFFQGLYPPAGDSAKITLRNSTEIEAPMNGYQLVAVQQTTSGSNSENTAWLQSTSKCHNAKVSSNNYFDSKPYKELLDSTADFYKSLTPMLGKTISKDEISYKNAYKIFDFLNVAKIHNSSDDLPSEKLPTDAQYSRLLNLANNLEANLAYNESDSIRAIAGSTLAGDVLTALKKTISSRGDAPKLNVQFGAYATFLSLFGLAQLPKVDNDFNGIPDYGSSMAFELVTNSSSSFPDSSDISVRFLFRNGSVIPDSKDTHPSAFPLFNQKEVVLPWSEFESQMKKISVSSQEEWCKACGESSGECAVLNKDALPTSASTTSGDNGITKVVAGVIGAMVTLGVVLGIQLLAMLVGGFRFVRKSKIQRVAEEGVKA